MAHPPYPPSVNSSGQLSVTGTGGGGTTPATPTAGTASIITTGGTAVILVTGPTNGGDITNPPNAASQGISMAENAYIDPVSTPGSTDASGNATTTVLLPGQSYSIPALATGVVIKGNAG